MHDSIAHTSANVRDGLTVRRSPRIVSQRISAQEVVVLHLDTSAYHSFNEVGGVLWELLETPRAVGELRQLLIDRYPDGADVAAVDIEEFLDQLAGRDLIAFDIGSACDAPRSDAEGG